MPSLKCPSSLDSEADLGLGLRWVFKHRGEGDTCPAGHQGRKLPREGGVISLPDAPGPSCLLPRWGPGSPRGQSEALFSLAPVGAGGPPCLGAALSFKEADG